MNIIEAIKSGKKIKRSSYAMFDYPHNFNFKTDDILSDDWEIQEKTITITESQFDEAVRHMQCSGIDERIKILKENLGF